MVEEFLFRLSKNLCFFFVGVRIADVAVLMVAADDGVKQQTREAYEAIQASRVPLIIAISKIDKMNSNIDR